MAISAPEYREQILAQGCTEGRDDAEAEVIIKLGGRLDQHIAQNDQQFRDVDSAIRKSARETVRDLTAELKLEVAQVLRIVADLRVENAEAFSKAQNRLSYAAIGIAALIVGATAAIITAVALLV